MAAHVNPKNGEAAPLVAEDIAEIVAQVRDLHAALCCCPARIYCLLSSASRQPGLRLCWGRAERRPAGQRDHLHARL